MDISVLNNLLNRNLDDSRRKMCVLLLTTAACLLAKKIQCNNSKIVHKRRVRRWCVRPFRNRKPGQNAFFNLYKEMPLDDKELFFNYTRMTKSMFEELLTLVGVHLRKKSQGYTVPPECRLLMTLRLLASGENLKSIAIDFRMGKSTVCTVFRETCEVLGRILQPLYLPQPSQQKWKQIAKSFHLIFQLPNCVGAVTAKQIDIKQPNRSHSQSNTIYFFAACDTQHKFTLIDIGDYNLDNDGGVFKESQFGKALSNHELDIPPDELLPGTNKIFPYFFCAQDDFPLQRNILRSYCKKNLNENTKLFNERLFKGTRCIDNCLGILTARWHIFHKSIYAFPNTVDKVLQATTCLHNFILTKQKELNVDVYCNDEFVDRDVNGQNIVPGKWRDQVPRCHAFETIRRRLGARNFCYSVMENRDQYMSYLNESRIKTE